MEVVIDLEMIFFGLNCRMKGHVKTQCRRLKQKNEGGMEQNWRNSGNEDPVINSVGLVVATSAAVTRFDDYVNRTVDKRFAPYCDDGFVFSRAGVKCEVVCLRDCGSLQSLINKKVLC